jgi:hypothetical protein
MSYSCYESDYRNQEQYVNLRDMAVKKAQALTKNEPPQTKEEEKDETNEFKASVTTTLSFNEDID